MIETNDYEKAKEDCWRDWTYEEPAEMSLRELGEARKVFDYAFDRAYQLGKAHSQPANRLENKRIQIAAMAMQGLLANGQSNSAGFVAEKSVRFADALLNELKQGE